MEPAPCQCFASPGSLTRYLCLCLCASSHLHNFPSGSRSVAEPHVAPGLSVSVLSTVNAQILGSLFVVVPLFVRAVGPASLLSSGEAGTTEGLLYPEARLVFLPSDIS